MRLGICLIIAVFALALAFGEPADKALAESSCHGASLGVGCSGAATSCTASASCSGQSSVGCAGQRGALRGVFQRRPLRRLFGVRGCG